MKGVLSCNYLMFACSSENYAQFWCSKLTDPSGVFSPCHSIINPESYKDVSLPIKQTYTQENVKLQHLPESSFLCANTNTRRSG